MQCIVTDLERVGTTRDPATIAKAFWLADRAMVESLRTLCVMTVELGDNTLFPASATGDEVGCVMDSAPAIVEALAWLRPRGMAKVVRDQDGEFIMLMQDGVEPAEVSRAAR